MKKPGTPLENGLFRLKMLLLQLSFNKEGRGAAWLEVDEVEAIIEKLDPIVKEQKLIETYCEEDIKAVREAFHNGQTHAEVFKNE